CLPHLEVALYGAVRRVPLAGPRHGDVAHEADRLQFEGDRTVALGGEAAAAQARAVSHARVEVADERVAERARGDGGGAAGGLARVVPVEQRRRLDVRE